MKNKKFIIIIVLILILGITGISYAYLQTKKDGNEQSLGIANFGLVILTDMKPVTIENIYPMSDYEGLKNKSNTFQIKNEGSVIANYQVSLIDKDIISTLENKDIRYKLTRTKHVELGEGAIEKEELEIDNLDANGVIDEGLIEAGEIIGYELVIWIDYDATPKANSIFTKVVSLEGSSANSLDTSGANYPELIENMIPVYNVAGAWVKADSRNLDSNNRWYNYSEQEWANAVTIKESEQTIQKNDGDINTKAMYFDGVNDWVNLGYGGYNFGTNVTLVIRFKTHILGGEFFGNWENGGLGFSINNNSTLNFQLHIGSSYSTLISNENLEIDKWYTVVGTYDGSQMKLYINGKLDNSMNKTGAINRAGHTTVLALGCNPYESSSHSSFSNITISDAYVYTRSLSEYEIVNCFGGEIIDYPTNNLLVYRNSTNITPSTNPTIEENGDLTFNGTSQRLVMGNRSQDFQDKVTLVARFKLEQLKTTEQHILANTEGATSAGSGLELALDSSSNLRFRMHVSGDYQDLLISKSMKKDEWYTVVASYDGNKMKLYMNGELCGEKEQTGNITVSVAPITIGANPDSTGNTFSVYANMTLSDAIVYTDVLTESEIKYAFSGEIEDYPKDNILTRFNGANTLSKSEYYQEADVGTGIPEEDISGMYVWIPRYKYVKFSNDNEMINIKFEHGIETSGDGENSYTHKSFTSDEKDLTGFWVSKFELSTDDESCINNQSIENCNKSGLKLYSLPDKVSLRNIDSNNMNSNISNMGEENIHMIKDKEYEAVMYLAKSRYGKEGNNLYKGEYKEIYKNNYYENTEGVETYKTGYSGGSREAELGVEGYLYNDLTLEDKKGYLGGGASTTGNVYGVYDLNGGSKEMTVSDNNKYYVRTFKDISSETEKVEATSDTGSRAVITHFREFGWIQ